MNNVLSHYITYLSKEKKYSLYTIKSYATDIESFAEFMGGEFSWNEVDHKAVRKWVATLSAQNLSHRSINRKISSLKSFFKFLYITKSVENYPLELIKNLKVEKKVQIPFSEAELAKITRDEFSSDFFGFRDYLIVMMFYNLGVRKSELIHLQIQDCYEDTIRVLGKGNKERHIPFSEKLKGLIKEYLQLRKNQYENPNSYFFLDKNGNKLNQTFVYRLINNYFRGVTFKEKRSPHILRHSFATHLIQNGAEINAVKELMGHSSLSATQIYVNHNIEQLKKVYAKSHPRFQKEE